MLVTLCCLHYCSIDNGWIQFHNVRIPRENMLMRWAKVSPEGQYTKPPKAQLSYGGKQDSRVSHVSLVSLFSLFSCISSLFSVLKGSYFISYCVGVCVLCL